MFPRKTDVKERVADMRSTIDKIYANIEDCRRLHENNSDFLACNALESAVAEVEYTAQKMLSSKHTERNKQNPLYKNTMDSFQVAIEDLDSALEEYSFCATLPPMS